MQNLFLAPLLLLPLALTAFPAMASASAALPAPVAPITPAQDEADEGWWSSESEPSGYHLGGYKGMLGGRLGTDGVLDSGSGQLRLVDGSTGEPLGVEGLDYGRGPRLYTHYEASLGDVEVLVSGLGLSETASGDERLLLSSQIKLSNPATEPRVVLLGAQLSPGANSPVFGAVPFEEGTRYERVGNLVLRDGQAVFGWLGTEPDVQIKESVDSPRAVAVECVWRLEIPAGGTAFVEVKLAGAPVRETVSEDAWRTKFSRANFAYLEETLRWQGWARGGFTAIKSNSTSVEHLVAASIHMLRAFSDAESETILRITNRPFGQPATDTAVEAEVVGLLHEFSMEELAAGYASTLIEEIPERMAGLDDERKLVYLHGLARALRLEMVGPAHMTLADAIVELGDPDVRVEPWHDPDVVRQDLLGIVQSVGRETEGLFTRLRWPEVEPGSSYEQMQLTRRALREREGGTAWEHFSVLLDSASPSGMGSMTGVDMDGQYCVGMMTLLRAFFLDDHGESLNLVPGACAGLVVLGAPMDTTLLPTRFGEMGVRLYYVTPKAVGAWIVNRQALVPERITITLPDGVVGRKVYGKSSGGSGRIVDPRTLELEMLPSTGRGMQVQVRVGKE
jgi:hypothetical protein